MTSVLNVDTIADKAGTGPVALTGQYAAKAWANLDGTGPTLRDSFNIASVVDRGTGDYTNNLTSSMTNANYNIAGSGDENQYYFVVVSSVTLTASAYAYGYFYAVSNTTDVDIDNAYSLVHGDLA